MHSDPLHRMALTLIMAVISLSVITPAQADTQLTYIDTGTGNNTRTTLIQIRGSKVRMGEVNSPVYSLYDHEQQTLFTVNDQTRQYIDSGAEKTRQRTRQAAAMQRAMQAQMMAQLPNMPEQQRQAVQQQLQQMQVMLNAPAPEIKQQPGGKALQIRGIDCQVSTVTYNGTPGRSICNAAPALMDAADYQTLLNMFTFMDNMAAESAKIHGFAAAPEPTANMHKSGLALQIQALPDGPRSELGAINTDPLDDKLFVLPEGYQLFEPASAMSAPQGRPAPQQ